MTPTESILTTDFLLLLSGSGFLFWPVCALVWRGKRSTSALRWMFLAQLAFNLVWAVFALLPHVNMEFRDWCSRSVQLNLFLFLPLAIGAAIYDFADSEQWAHISPSEWRDTLHHLRDEYSARLADPNLSAPKREELERLLKGLRKLLGNKNWN